MTHIVPVHEGHSLQTHPKSLRVGGQIVDHYTMSVIRKRTDKGMVTPFELLPGSALEEDESSSGSFTQLPARGSMPRPGCSASPFRTSSGRQSRENRPFE